MYVHRSSSTNSHQETRTVSHTHWRAALPRINMGLNGLSVCDVRWNQMWSRYPE